MGEHCETRRARLLAFGIVAAPVIVVAWGAWCSWSTASNAAQLAGSLMALVGLLVAYLRAKNPDVPVSRQVRNFIRRALCGVSPPEVHHRHVEFTGGYRFDATAHSLAPLETLDGLPIQQQVDRLARYLRDVVNERHEKLLAKLDELEADIAKAHDHADEKARETYRKIMEHLAELDRKVTRVQVLDLSVALFGLYVATIGLALVWWA